MIVLVPYFGDLEKFRPLLELWLAAYRSCGIDRERHPAVLLSDDFDVEGIALDLEVGAHLVPQSDLAGFADLIREGQPFDKKGALVCRWLLDQPYPTLVLDADALLARDPAPTLEPFREAAVAMPLDHGSICCHRKPTLEGPFAGIKKLCAGVQYFGGGNDRSRLVAGYRRAFEEIVALPEVPWTPPLRTLTEQFAWSVCAHRRGGRILPASMNWAPEHLGENAFAVVNHYFGRGKWSLKPESGQAPGAAEP